MAVEAPGTNAAVTGAIRHASRVTGTNFQYLVATAQVESRFNPTAAARTSSARGLFQFIEQTWLATLKEQGPALGYAQVASAIDRAPSGQYVVTDPRLNDRIMKLRNDPTANAVMAAAYTKANAGKLAGRLGRNATEGELYVAHFLGSQGAGRLISLAEAKPGMRADEAFPGPAKANPSIFYDRGRPRSVAEVYRTLVNRYAVARNDQTAPAAKQAAARRRQAAAVPRRRRERAASFCAGHRRADRCLRRGRATQRAAGADRGHRPGVPRPVPQQPRGGRSGGERAVERADRRCSEPAVQHGSRSRSSRCARRDHEPVPGPADRCARAVPRPRLIAVKNSATCLNVYGERFLKFLRVASGIVGAAAPAPRCFLCG